MENEVASRYGLALYSLAVDTHNVDKWQEEIKALDSIFKENADFIMVLASSFITISERKEILRNALMGVSSEIVALLEIVIENHRTLEIPNIFMSFNSYCNEAKGIIEGYLYSSLRLDEAMIHVVEKKISDIERRSVELHNIVDPSLIGGIKVVVHDRIYDGSVKNHLEQMKKDLLKRRANK